MMLALPPVISLLLLVPPMTSAERSRRQLVQAVSSLNAADFRSGGSCSDEASCRREVVSARAVVVGHPLDKDDCGTVDRIARDEYDVNNTNSSTLEVQHSCEDTEGRLLSQGEGDCQYEVCAWFSWAQNGTLDYQVVVTHEVGAGEDRAVTVKVYLNFDDEPPATNSGALQCSPDYTCGEISACGGDSAEASVVAYDSYGDGWIDPFKKNTNSAFWLLTGADRTWTGTLYGDHLAARSRICLNPGDYDFTAPGSVAWPDDVSWEFCGETGFAGEALAVTVESGECFPVGDVVVVAPMSLEAPGTGSESMCRTCTSFTSEMMGGHFGVYHEPDCDPATYTDDPGFLHSGGGSGCVVRDYFDDADVTCRFCVINRERWRKENPNVRNLDWPDCPSCVADFLGEPRVKFKTASLRRSLNSVDPDQVTLIVLVCAIGVALCVLFVCACCILCDREQKEEAPEVSSPEKRHVYHKNNLSSIFVATEPYVSSSSESVGSVIVNESRGGGDHLPGRRSKQAAVREDRGEGGLTSSSATSNRQKRKRGGIDPTQAAGTAAVGDTANGVGQSRSSTDMEGIAKRDPDNAFRMSAISEEDATSSMAEAANPIYNPKHRAWRDQQPEDQHPKQLAYDEEYVDLEQGEMDRPVSPPPRLGTRPEQEVEVEVFRSGIPSRLHAARGVATVSVPTKRPSSRSWKKSELGEDIGREAALGGPTDDCAASTDDTTALDPERSPPSPERSVRSGSSLSHRQQGKIQDRRDFPDNHVPVGVNRGVKNESIDKEDEGLGEVERRSEENSRVKTLSDLATPTRSRHGARSSSGSADSRERSERSLPSSRPKGLPSGRSPGGGSEMSSEESGRVKTLSDLATPTRSRHGARSPSGSADSMERSERSLPSSRPKGLPSGRSPGGGGGSGDTSLSSTSSERGRRRSSARKLYHRARSLGNDTSGRGRQRNNTSGGGGSSQGDERRQQHQGSKRRGFSQSPFRTPRQQRFQVGPRRSSQPGAEDDRTREKESERGRPRERGPSDTSAGDGKAGGDRGKGSGKPPLMAARTPRSEPRSRLRRDDDGWRGGLQDVATPSSSTRRRYADSEPRTRSVNQRRRSAAEQEDSSKPLALTRTSSAPAADDRGARIAVPRVEASSKVARPLTRLSDHVAGRVKTSGSMKRGSSGRGPSAVPVLDFRRNSLSEEVANSSSGSLAEMDVLPPRPASGSSSRQADPSSGKLSTSVATQRDDRTVIVRAQTFGEGEESRLIGDAGLMVRAQTPSSEPRGHARQTAAAARRRSEGEMEKDEAGLSTTDPDADNDGTWRWETAVRESIPKLLQRPTTEVTVLSPPPSEGQGPGSNGHSTATLVSAVEVVASYEPPARVQRSVSSDGAGDEDKDSFIAAATASPSSVNAPTSAVPTPKKWPLLRKKPVELDAQNSREGEAWGTPPVDDSNDDSSSSSDSSVSMSDGTSNDSMSSTSTSSEDSDAFSESDEALGEPTKPSNIVESGVAGDVDTNTAKPRQSARSRIRELSYQSARSRSRGSMSSLTRVVEVSDESASSVSSDSSRPSWRRTLRCVDRDFNAVGTASSYPSEHVIMAGQQQQEEGGPYSSTPSPESSSSPSKDGNDPLTSGTPLSPSRTSSSSSSSSSPSTFRLLRHRYQEVEKRGTRAVENEVAGKESSLIGHAARDTATAKVASSSGDGVLSATRSVTSSVPSRSLPSKTSPGSGVNKWRGARNDGDVEPGTSRERSIVSDHLLGSPRLSEDAVRAAEAALDVPSAAFVSSRGTPAAPAAASNGDAGSTLSDYETSRTSLDSTVPTEGLSPDVGHFVGAGRECGSDRGRSRDRRGGGLGRLQSEPGHYEFKYDDDDADSVSCVSDTWSAFTGQSGGARSAGDSIASSAAAYQSARGSRESLGTRGRGGWREQARMRRAMVLAAQKAQEALQAGVGGGSGGDADVELNDDLGALKSAQDASVVPTKVPAGQGEDGDVRSDGEREQGDDAPQESSVSDLPRDVDGEVFVPTGEGKRRRVQPDTVATSAGADARVEAPSASEYFSKKRVGPEVYEGDPRDPLGTRGHILGARSVSGMHFSDADATQSLTSSSGYRPANDRNSPHQSAASFDRYRGSGGDGDDRRGLRTLAPPMSPSEASSVGTKRSRSVSSGSNIFGSEAASVGRGRSSWLLQRDPQLARRNGEGAAAAAAAAFVDKESGSPPQSRGEPSAEIASSAASLLRSRSQQTELRQQRDKDKEGHVHYGHRRHRSSATDGSGEPSSTPAGPNGGGRSSGSVGSRYGHGDEAIDQETEMDESSHNESSHSFGSASTLAKSADANGFYGFLRPSEELS